LLYQIFIAIFNMMLIGGWIAVTFGLVMRSRTGHNAPLPPAFFIFFPLLWLFFMVFWVLTLVLAILYSIKAGRGEWAEYPLLGGLARRILKMGPGGTALPA
jgi:hypothetical protein